jgi:hypothetical protein
MGIICIQPHYITHTPLDQPWIRPEVNQKYVPIPCLSTIGGEIVIFLIALSVCDTRSVPILFGLKLQGSWPVKSSPAI